MPELAEEQASHTFERAWIMRHGVSNFRSLTAALRRQGWLKFSAVNPAMLGAGGKSAPAGGWALALIQPTTEAGFWWVTVVEYGTGMVQFSPVAHPAEFVADVLARCGVCDTRFNVQEAVPSDVHPALSLRDRAQDRRFVYFIQADGTGLVKIGVSGDVRGRLRALQTASPVGLTLLAVIPGVGQEAEARLHEQFAADRSHGEWFRFSPELLAYINEHGVRP